jgi:hypothetical protein
MSEMSVWGRARGLCLAFEVDDGMKIVDAELMVDSRTHSLPESSKSPLLPLAWISSCKVTAT